VPLLIILGAVLQACGFALVALELTRIPKQVREYKQRDATVYPRTLEGTTIFPLTVTAGESPSMEQRVDAVEAKLERVRADCDTRSQDLRHRIEMEADRVQRIVCEQCGYVDTKLEGLIKGVAIGRLPLRWVGLILFVVGLALSTVGAVVS
jgi:hypothetical protein